MYHLTPAANTLMPQSAQREVSTVDPLRAAGVCLLAGKDSEGFTWKIAET